MVEEVSVPRVVVAAEERVAAAGAGSSGSDLAMMALSWGSVGVVHADGVRGGADGRSVVCVRCGRGAVLVTHTLARRLRAVRRREIVDAVVERGGSVRVIGARVLKVVLAVDLVAFANLQADEVD